MITKKICVLLCFQSFLCAKHFFFNKGSLYSRSFQNIQGLLWKIQGLFKDVPQFSIFKDFLRTWCFFKDFSRPVRTMPIHSFMPQFKRYRLYIRLSARPHPVDGKVSTHLGSNMKAQPLQKYQSALIVTLLINLTTYWPWWQWIWSWLSTTKRHSRRPSFLSIS